MSVFDDRPSTCSRNRCLIDRPPLQKDTMDPELAQAQWTREERLLAIYEDEEERLLNEDLDEFAIRRGYLNPV